jgi:two-component system NtrC family sensor kinase
MKRLYCLFFCSIICFGLKSQPLPEALQKAFNPAVSDVEKGRVLMGYVDLKTDQDTLLNYLEELKKLFEEKKQPVIVDYIQLGICRQLARGAQYAEAINELFKLIARFEARNDAYGVMVCNRHFSYAYYSSADSAKALYYDRITVKQSEGLGNKDDMAVAYNNLAADMAEYGHFDSAFYFVRNALRFAEETDNRVLISKTLSTTAESYIAIKQYDSALHYIRRSIPMAIVYSQFDYVYGLNDFAQVYLATNHMDSVIYYSTQAVAVARNINLMNQVLRSYRYLSLAYKQTGPLDSAYKYLDLMVSTKDSMYSAEKIKLVQLISIREQNRLRETEQQKTDLTNKIKIYSLLAGLAVFCFIGFLFFRNSRKEKNAKMQLQKKNDLIEKALGDLKATQSQLIQSEKMASLGELTAGIAHEIQNPLNFVNNFSEVNKELAAELQEELESGNIQSAKEITEDIKNNSEKINHHGKRADAIVKGMLQHSSSKGGQKEPTDINKLADEYLRLAYHGIRAKDNTFNATLKTEYDESIGTINIVPQDIGRVLLNLITNAFYAVGEKSKTLSTAPAPTAVENRTTDFEPTVIIKTAKTDNRVFISVSDNGNGIPSLIIDKIFQPFFTTKPTGQGTGLGLSLAYDIVKTHGGTITADNTSNGVTFKIELPIN